MNPELFSTMRIAGALMLLSVFIILAGVGLIASQGRLGGMVAAFGGLGPDSGDATGLRTIARAAIPYMMAQLAGLSLFAMLLHQAGDRELAVVGITLFVFAASIAVVEGSFHASVTVWAAEEKARSGSIPAFFEPLRIWMNTEIQRVYITFLLTSLLLFSLSALRTGLFPAWLGWGSIAWSLLAFPIYFFILGAPLIYLVTMLMFGTGLLISG